MILTIPRAACLGIVCLALPLAACSANRDEPTPAELRAIRDAQNIFPQNYRADVVAFMRNYLNDPVGVRSAAISAPQLKDLSLGARYFSCLRYDARKAGGQYAGVKTALVIYVSGKLDRVIEPPAGREPRESGEIGEACRDAALGPFPELQAMTR